MGLPIWRQCPLDVLSDIVLQVAVVLADKAITLRIDEDSQQAQQLSVFCPFEGSPVLILSQYVSHSIYCDRAPWIALVCCTFLTSDPSQGRILMKLESGLSKDDFKEAIINILGNLSPIAQLHSATLSIPSSDPSPPSSSENTANTPTSSSGHPNQDVGAPAPNLPTRLQMSPAVQDLLDEGAKRLEADKKGKDIAEKSERKAIAESRQNARVNAPESAQAKQASYAQEQRRRQKEQWLERERIMAVIENDKKERKEKEERRRATARADAEGSLGDEGKIPAELTLSKSYANAISSSTRKNCALQIRLLDGSTIRHHFPPSSTLRTHVRPWILSEEAGGPGVDPPYTFKQILTPLPNRTISISEEEEPLSSLGLMPSATLVKVPVPKFTDAYSGRGVGYFSRGVNLGFNALHGGLGLVSGLLARFLGLGQAVPYNEVEGSNSTQWSSKGEGSEGLGTGRDPQQFYNGNQVCAFS